MKTAAPSSRQPPEMQPRPQAPIAPIEKPLIARLQESDVVRTLSGILATGGIPDVTRLGWPTLRAGLPMTTFVNAMRDMRPTSENALAVNAMPGTAAHAT